MEQWRDIEGYEYLYQVSNEGRVKSLNYRHTGRDKLLKPQSNNKGYLQVNLYKDRKRKHQNVHRLVAEAFLPKPDGYTQVNHKDEDKTNNTVWINEDGSVDLEKSNLEWCINEYNYNYGTRIQRIAEANSKRVYQYTLNGELVKIWSSANE